MARSLVMSLIGAAGMAAALLVGCGDNDAKPTPSKAGQSCVRTADCADGLSCIANVCYASTGSGGSGGQAGASSAPGPVLGGVGESCTSRLDCASPLACFNQRCTSATSTGEGGAPSMPSAQLGDRGETCRVNADCNPGLICVPGYVTSGVGQCDLASYGYKPSGKSCVGECSTATDCCELPPAVHTLTINSCADVNAQLGTEDCAAANPAPAVAQLCFMKSVYCDCAKNTWTCDENSRCQYTAKCTTSGATLGGCPTYSRGNFAVPACDTKAQKCTGGATIAACTKDADCDAGLETADTFETCSKGECTCNNGGCYHMCTQDIDCAPGRVCDTKKTNLCVPQTGCKVDLDCAVGNRVGDQCVNEVCKRPCVNDHDCSGSGLITGAPFNGMVCSAAGYCESLAGECTSDDQCKTALPGSTNVATGVKAFCVTTPTATVSSVASAITD